MAFYEPDRVCRPAQTPAKPGKTGRFDCNNPKKGIDNPTTERLLKMFDNITLTIVQLPGQTIRHLLALTAVQIRILELIGLSANVYTCLADN